MSKSNVTEIEEEKEIGSSIVQQFICRVLKKNHDAMLQIAMQANDIARKYGALHVEYFQLSSTENMTDWTKIAKTVSANQDEEVWMEQVLYRDSKHRDEYMAMCGNDENMNRLYKQFMDLIIPGSTIMGNLSASRCR
jgi:uncharacterized protein YbaA (DUF1428 family)